MAFTGGKHSELLWLVENTSLCSLLLFFIFLYLEILNLFLCPVNETGDGHLFQLKCILKPAGEYVWQPESLLLLGPLNATCPSLVALPQPEVTRVKAYLVRRRQPYVVSMDGFVIMCLSPQHFMELKCLSAAAVKVGVAHCLQTDSSGWLGLFGVGLGTSSQAFVYLPQTSCRNKRTGGVCAKGYTSTSYKNANAASGLLRVFSDVQ